MWMRMEMWINHERFSIGIDWGTDSARARPYVVCARRPSSLSPHRRRQRGRRQRGRRGLPSGSGLSLLLRRQSNRDVSKVFGNYKTECTESFRSIWSHFVFMRNADDGHGCKINAHHGTNNNSKRNNSFVSLSLSLSVLCVWTFVVGCHVDNVRISMSARHMYDRFDASFILHVCLSSTDVQR